MDRNQTRLALFKMTLLCLLGTTWVFGSFIYATRPEAGAPAQNALDTLMRLPASLPAKLPENLPKVFASKTKTLQPIEMNVAKLPCWDNVKDVISQSTNARWIRLTGHACQVHGSTVGVRNLSNGYVATVFDSFEGSKAGQMTTDYIPLQMGKNDILIRFESGPGATLESRIAILRLQP